MEKIWNEINENQRRELIVSVYNSDVLFVMYGNRTWDELPYGVKRRMERLTNVK
jgi:hypothetical protein